MKRTISWITVLFIMLVLPAAFTAAQDEQPKENPPTDQPKPLPALPTAPYVKGDAEAIQAHVDAAKKDLETVRGVVAEKKKAAAEEGLTPEEKEARRRIEVR